jgi:NAD(P) transhydrogenase subunit alpha
LAEEIGKMDAVISTAAVPGRPAPLLVTEQAVKKMSPGSVIVDLAAETGGNCELAEPGQTVVKEEVTIVGPVGLASSMPDHASSLYARNVQSLLELMVSEGGELALDFEDEIIKGACITHGGEIVHEGARQAAGVAA